MMFNNCRVWGKSGFHILERGVTGGTVGVWLYLYVFVKLMVMMFTKGGWNGKNTHFAF